MNRIQSKKNLASLDALDNQNQKDLFNNQMLLLFLKFTTLTSILFFQVFEGSLKRSYISYMRTDCYYPDKSLRATN